ncbi:pyroglutamyl-peptidase I [Sporolactobacillus terrae]|uniref:pyroglutamyl-peptidase I n=1 Tax=Sporolactobacillus terrae TaxID=269673 RepID=UPI0006876AD4|nr:pyroglutamyl-peptidase I [Sporolactobacillus terrae]
MRVLLSGFAPFGGSKWNASWEAVRRLDGMQTGESIELFATKLPVTYNEAAERLLASARVICPDIIIAVGQAGGRKAITPERFAVNRIHSERPDNDGVIIKEQRISENGPQRYASDLPLNEIVSAIQHMNIPAELSEDAGTFVCNHVFYNLMHGLQKFEKPIIGGFIHVPYLSEQIKNSESPSLHIEQLTEAMRIAAIESAHDLLNQTKLCETK